MSTIRMIKTNLFYLKVYFSEVAGKCVTNCGVTPLPLLLPERSQKAQPRLPASRATVTPSHAPGVLLATGK